MLLRIDALLFGDLWGTLCTSVPLGIRFRDNRFNKTSNGTFIQ